jgi:hypothetical protein
MHTFASFRIAAWGPHKSDDSPDMEFQASAETRGQKTAASLNSRCDQQGLGPATLDAQLARRDCLFFASRPDLD